jgi:uncharacterized membrane protein
MTTGKNNENAISHRFLMLFIVGFLMTLIGIIILMVAAMLYSGGSASTGVIIFIGPIPIVIGAGPQAGLMVLFSIILAVLSIIIFLIMRRKGSEEKV